MILLHEWPSRATTPVMAVSKHGAERPQKGLLGTGKGEGVWGGGGRGRLYTYRYTVTTTENDSCIKMRSDESHFNVSLIAASEKLWTKTVSTHKAQPFWRETRAEARSSRSPSAYQPNAKPAHTTPVGLQWWLTGTESACPRPTDTNANDGGVYLTPD